MNERAERFVVLRRKLDKNAKPEIINVGVIVGRLMWSDPSGRIIGGWFMQNAAFASGWHGQLDDLDTDY